MKKKNFINYCGLLGVAAFISYTAAVVFSPLAYPGYNWMAQAVSDLSGSTVIVVLLSIISLILIIISGIKNRSCCSYGVFAGIALGMMMVGALGMNIVPKEYFGIVERFSVFAATGFQAVLGMHLYRMELNN